MFLGKSSDKYYEVTIPSNVWVSNGANPSTAEITVLGIQTEDRPYVFLNFGKISNLEDTINKIEKYNTIFRVETISKNTLKFYGSRFLLTEDLEVLVKVS